VQALEKHRQLLNQLQNLIFGPKSTAQSCSEVLTYFLEKLTLSQITTRKLARNVRTHKLSLDQVQFVLQQYLHSICNLELIFSRTRGWNYNLNLVCFISCYNSIIEDDV